MASRGKKPRAGFVLVLHSHQPYIRHPEHDYFLEENWFYESAIECYMPLAGLIERLSANNAGFALTLSLSPTLLDMSADTLLNNRLMRHMQNLSDLLYKETIRTRRKSRLNKLANQYLKNILKLQAHFQTALGCRLVNAFQPIGKSKNVELITTSATHAFLPYLMPFPRSVRAQIQSGLSVFKHYFGMRPEGFWLPECGYQEGIDSYLKKAGTGYFFISPHGISIPKTNLNKMPVRCRSGAVAFQLEPDIARLVWCSKTGYPADANYRDFHTDIGFELPMDYLLPHMHPDGFRVQTGIKYNKITSVESDNKSIYDIDKARLIADRHAQHFVEMLERRAVESGAYTLITCAFDAELFGHWWHEGLWWLEKVIEMISRSEVIEMTTPSRFLKSKPVLNPASPTFSSWGEGGYGRPWLGGLKQVHRSTMMFEDALDSGRFLKYPGQKARAIRELMLMQSSDWPFLMDKSSHEQYAISRIREHARNLEHIITTGMGHDEVEVFKGIGIKY